MAEFTDYFENFVVDRITKKSTTAFPDLFCALMTAAASPETGGVTEVTGGSYARQQIPTANWGTSAGGIASNTEPVNFANMPAATVTHFGFYDALTLGNLLMYSPLDANVVVAAGLTFSFLVGDIDLQVM